ncbi:hypothetical protein B0T10DRAFT_611945 [Thelonectria olida]|uniref:Uncharacterized protein n=1 Tax=Thelonectria olida TaxID=1576542 RepID=A0A9P9AG52_9HYPO|nr:hypothetical protein B0T10DRAFT_611945 [Thelonectria olida]
MPKMKPLRFDDLEDHDGVSYKSTNTAVHASFTAVSAPNSRHAARLAQLAVSVQKPQRKKHSTRKLQLPPPVSTHRHQIQYVPDRRVLPQEVVDWDESASTASWVSGETVGAPPQLADYRLHPNSDSITPQAAPQNAEAFWKTAPDAWSEASSGMRPTEPYPDGQRPRAEEISPPEESGAVPYSVQQQVTTVIQPRSSQAAPKVTRWRTDSKTTYEVRYGSGSLRVSAPVGSNEVALFNAVADANADPNRGSPEVSIRKVSELAVSIKQDAE